MLKNPNLYEYHYPQHLSSSKLVHTLRSGAKVRYKEKEYSVGQVMISRIEGSIPQIVLKELA